MLILAIEKERETWKINSKAVASTIGTRTSKCLHHYFYFQHAEFGLMHLAAADVVSVSVMVYVNGRLWLARQLDRAGVGYQRRDNSFVWIEDLPRAQALAQPHLRVQWPGRLLMFRTPEALAAIYPALVQYPPLRHHGSAALPWPQRAGSRAGAPPI
jgi:hypothetical protein